MAETNSDATSAEKMALAYYATIQIQGLADAVLDLVRGQHVDSHASEHHAALGMLAQIRDLSDNVFNLVHGDPNDPFTRAEVKAMLRKLGIESLQP